MTPEHSAALQTTRPTDVSCDFTQLAQDGSGVMRSITVPHAEQDIRTILAYNL
jgi:hypothetical protein